MADRAHQKRQEIVSALGRQGDTVSWAFAFSDAMEAGREAELFYHSRLLPLGERNEWSEQDLAELMQTEFQYQDMSRHSRRLMDSLLERPAPDLGALLWKIEYAFGNRRGLGSANPLSPDAVDAVLVDARRLLGGARDRTAARPGAAPGLFGRGGH